MKKYFILNLIFFLFQKEVYATNLKEVLDVEYKEFVEKNSCQEYKVDLEKNERLKIQKNLFECRNKAVYSLCEPHKILFLFGIKQDKYHLYFNDPFIDAVINLHFVEQEIYKTVQINELKEAQTAAKAEFAQKLKVVLNYANGAQLKISGFEVDSAKDINETLNRLFSNHNYKEGQLKFINNSIYFCYSLVEEYLKNEFIYMHKASSNFTKVWLLKEKSWQNLEQLVDERTNQIKERQAQQLQTLTKFSSRS